VDRLQRLCAEYLDNADLDIKLDEDEFKLRLIFFVAGSDTKVTIELTGLREVSMRKHVVDRPFFPIMKTSVTAPRLSLPAEWGTFELKTNDLTSYLWKVELEGSLSLYATATGLAWDEERLSQTERAYLKLS
jgi:hypothetical protein